jgi:multiple sugar transport system permease protein/putative aldouronate transport system permease protein
MLGLINSFWVYVIPGMFPVYNMVLVKTYMENIPAALEESAAIDGAGYFRRYLFIMLPMSLPILATIAVFIAVGQWSAFMDTVLYINTSRLYTLQYRLYQYFHQVDAIVQQIENGMVNESQISNMITPTSVRLTATVVITLPIMFVYPFMQRYFMKGIMIGAIKG